MPSNTTSITRYFDNEHPEAIQREETTEVTVDTPASIEVTKNAKGDRQWTVKIYCSPDKMEEGMMEAIRVDQLLENQYRANR